MNEDEILKRLRVVSDQEALQADIHVCGSSPHMPGSLSGNCAHCGQKIFYMKPMGGMKRLCLSCAQPYMQPESELVINQKTLKEVAALLYPDRN